MIMHIFHYFLVISILVFVHELGHFLVARWCRIGVLRFSIGFGKPLFSWWGKQGTQYVIASLPLGGYIKLAEQETDLQGARFTFAKASLLSKMMVILAGPFFNLCFAVLLYWVVLLQGVSYIVPILGPVPEHSIAAKAGLSQGDQIIAVQDKSVQSWSDIFAVLLKAWHQQNSRLSLDIQRQTVSGNVSVKKVELILPKGNAQLSFTAEELESLGIIAYDPIAPIIKSVVPNQPAAKAGFKAGDRMIRINQHVVHSRREVVNYIRKYPNQVLNVVLEREGQQMTIPMVPATKTENNQSLGYVGVVFEQGEWPVELLCKQTLSIGEAFQQAVQKTVEYSRLTLEMFFNMVTGKLSWHHLSGPVTIAKQATESLQYSVNTFLLFLAMLSVSLGVVNLLPLPLLDGGQVLIYSIEGLLRRQFTETIKIFLFKLGALILLALMMIAFYNDFVIK